MNKTKTLLSVVLVVLVFNSSNLIPGAQAATDVDISGRWVDDRDQVDIKQSGDQVTGEIGINGSSFTGTRSGDTITFTLIYRFDTHIGPDRKSEGELKINSDGTVLTGTRSGGLFKKGSKWVLTKEAK